MAMWNPHENAVPYPSGSRNTVLDSAQRHIFQKQKWFCHLALLMPDHVHLIVSFPDIPSFSPVISDWKRWLTIRQKIRWQENFFDHRLRRDESLVQKADYILNNPVRAGFVKKFEDWPYIWISEGD